MRKVLVAMVVGLALAACSSGAVVEDGAGGGGAAREKADGGALDASECDPLVPHADASPNGC